MASLCGARSLAFHCGFYSGVNPEDALDNVIRSLSAVQSILASEELPIILRPETQGKLSQIGSLEEVIRISKRVVGIAPCIDFAHLFARSLGKLNGYVDFVRVLRRLRDTLGGSTLKRMHLHVSGIQYGPRGERRHLLLKESDFDYVGLLRALRDLRVRGIVICESPDPEQDALLLKKTYENLVRKGD
jgi:deoxyribonuclease-4